MTASPADMPAQPAELPRRSSRPALVIEIEAEYADAYDRRAGTVVVKVFPSQDVHGHVRLGIRQGDRKAEARLNPAALRQLAADLASRADLIDPPNQKAAPTATTGGA